MNVRDAGILVQTGLIAGVRGPHGGLRLGRPAETITIGEIARVFEPEDCPVNFMAATATEAKLSQLLFRAHREFFRPLETMQLSELAEAIPQRFHQPS